MFTSIKELLSAEDGRLSSTRLAFLMMSATVGLVWAYISVKNGRVEEIPMGVAGVLFTYMAGKVGQSFLERPSK